MKRIIPLVVVLCLVLSSCVRYEDGFLEAITTECTTQITEEVITAEQTTAQQVIVEEQPSVYRNPLNGEPMQEPYSGRVFSVSINNVSSALPHRSVVDADIFFEMYINDYCTRGLALFSDIKKAESIGSIRSTRYNFTDIAKAYNTVMVYSGGSNTVLNDMKNEGINGIVADIPVGYRDTSRSAAGYAYEHTLYATGESLYNAAAKKGYSLSAPGKDYGMIFADEGTPVNGSPATEVSIDFTLNGRKKNTTMKYDAVTDEYVYLQYNKEMADEKTGEKEGFRNVIVILAPMIDDPVYHIADIFGIGEGYFACGGKIIPIIWWMADPERPFSFATTDGKLLNQEVGSTYIAIAPEGSPVNYK